MGIDHLTEKWKSWVSLRRGKAQTGSILYRVWAETGFDAYALSRDTYLLETGRSQAPLYYSYKADLDPLGPVSGLYLACLMEHEAAAYWEGWCMTNLDCAPQTWDVAYLAALDYSIGPRAVKHLLRMSATMRDTLGGSLTGRILWIGKNVNLDTVGHRAFWGRQKPAQIVARIAKKQVWLEKANALVPFDQNEGPYPSRIGAISEDGLCGFPATIKEIAKKAGNPATTAEVREVLHSDLKDYIRDRRRFERRVGEANNERGILKSLGAVFLREDRPRDWCPGGGYDG